MASIWKSPSSQRRAGKPRHSAWLERIAGLDATAAAGSIDNVNQLLADTMTLRDLYKKHHWQASGPSFYIMHLLFDKHFEEQSKLVDLLAERVQTLGGVTIAMAPDSLRPLSFRVLPKIAKTRRLRSRACFRPRSHPLEAGRWLETPQSVAIWEQMTSSSLMSSAPMSCRYGSLPNTCNEHEEAARCRKKGDRQ